MDDDELQAYLKANSDFDIAKDRVKNAKDLAAKSEIEKALSEYRKALMIVYKLKTESDEFKKCKKSYRKKVIKTAAKWAESANLLMDSSNKPAPKKNAFGHNDNIDDIAMMMYQNCKRTKVRDENETFANMIGLDDLKEDLIENIIKRYQHPKLYFSQEGQRNNFFLHFGSSGTNKSAAFWATVQEAWKFDPNIEVFEIGQTEIKSVWIGQGPKNVQATFKMIRDHAPCMVLIDEVDGIFYETNSKAGHNDGVVQEFLVQMDPKNPDNDGLIIFCTTNQPENLSRNFHRRFTSIWYHKVPTKKVLTHPPLHPIHILFTTELCFLCLFLFCYLGKIPLVPKQADQLQTFSCTRSTQEIGCFDWWENWS